MRWVLGPIPPSNCLDPEAAGWERLRSPTVRWAILRAALGMIPCFGAAAYALFRAAGETPIGVFLAALILPALIVPVHEVAHMIGYGVDPRSTSLITGIWPAHGIWYVLFDGPLRRDRVLFMLAAPVLLVSVPLGLAAVVVGGPSGWLLTYLAAMHTALCIVDVGTFVRILRQVPRCAWVHNQGWNTYWSETPPALLESEGKTVGGQEFWR
ncbi:MAG: DUF3267 domain-containing protein [Verrucomicrobiales bacterium]|nr:DUF3267 domain-containing protein [Verrucomicrobiales bacterium]